MTRSPQENQSRSWLRTLGVWAALFVVSFYVGYQHVFSTFAIYDDEGYVMMSLRSFMDGVPLYDETFSQYGPGFFLVESAIHRLLALPITHDVTRLKTVTIWLMVAGLCAWFVSRLSGNDAARSRGLSILCFCLVFLHLDRLCLEPGHPQELCALGVATCLVMSLGLAKARSNLRIAAAIGLGVVSGWMLLTKLNIGLFLTTGIGSALVFLLPTARPSTWLRYIVSFGLVALPLLLYRHQLLNLQASLLAWVTAGAAVAVIYSLRTMSRVPTIRWPELFAYTISIAGTLLAILAWTLASGTSAEGLLYGIIKQHTALEQQFFHPPPVLFVWVVLGSIAAICAHRGRKNTSAWTTASAALVLGFCLLAYLLETWQPLVHGLQTRGQAGLLMSFVPALLSLLIIHRGDDTQVPRVVLACVALLQPLAAYPTPGTQTAVGSFTLLVACLVLIADGMATVPQASRAKGQATGATNQSAMPWRLATLGVLVIASIGTLGVRSISIAHYRAGLEPLALPGAHRLRLDEAFVRRQHWLVNQLRNSADTFVFGEHCSNSLYFWSGIDPPTSLNAGFWPFILRDSEQQRIVDRLQTFENPYVIRIPFDAELPSGPLSKYIDGHFQKAYAAGETEIWVRQRHQVNVSVDAESRRSSYDGI